MRILLLVAFILPLAAVSQTTKDYNQAMEQFQKFYNAGQGDSINAMYGHDWDQMKSIKPLWTNDKNTGLLEEYGYLKSYRFIGIDTQDPNHVYVFETVFSKAGAKTTSLTLDSENHLGTFRFITTSEGIDKLMAKERQDQ